VPSRAVKVVETTADLQHLGADQNTGRVEVVGIPGECRSCRRHVSLGQPDLAALLVVHE
jgi:hypothetical protein